MGKALPSHRLISADKLEKLALAGIDRLDWYQQATEQIVKICAQENWDVVEFSRKLAILSPQVAIRRNVRMALEYVGNGHHMGNTVRSVKRSLEIYETTGKIGGNKVPEFARALLGDDEAIVLDTWMSKAMVREIDPSVKHFARKATKLAAQKLVRKVAKRLGISPRECQAAIWSGKFREAGQQPQYFPVCEEYAKWIAYDRQFPLNGAIVADGPIVTTESADSFDFGANAEF